MERNITKDFRVIEWEDVEWMHLVQHGSVADLAE
jgi:hypothetical protein